LITRGYIPGLVDKNVNGSTRQWGFPISGYCGWRGTDTIMELLSNWNVDSAHKGQVFNHKGNNHKGLNIRGSKEPLMFIGRVTDHAPTNKDNLEF
jgi:hypothetical protein